MTLTRAQIEDRIRYLEEDIRVTIADLDAKRRRQDWHGVRDACVDIETMEAKLNTFRACL